MNYLATALEYLPTVFSGVTAVEQAMKGAPGASKKAVVLASIDAVAQVGETVPQPEVMVISALIDAVVKALNATGWFTHKAAPAAK